jgi:phage-related protein
MADNTIDSLAIEISSNMGNADKSIERLANSLTKIANSLGGINPSMFSNLASGIGDLKVAMDGMNTTVKTADFTRVAKGLNSIATVNVQGVTDASRAIRDLVTNFNQIGTIAFDSQGILNIANSVAQLGRSTVTQAASNIPKLTTELKNLVAGLNGLNFNGFDLTGLTSLTTAISKMGSAAAGRAASTNIEQLGKALKNMLTTLSTAPTVSNNIIQMTNALAGLTAAGGKAGVAANSLVSGFRSLPTTTSKAKNSFGGLASAIGKFYATYWMIIRSIGLFKKAIDISSDLTEVQNVVDVTFGDLANKVDELASHSIKDYGMSELTVKQVSSRFQAMGTSMGFAQDKMADMSLELTKLTADMASFYNESQGDVAKRLQSVFTGETEPLRRYGIDLTNATLQEWANKKGIDAKVNSMTQAQKTMLRYAYVMENTSAAQGDFARTSGSWANQLRMLVQQFEQLGSVVGGTLVNAFKPLITVLNNVMQKVISFAKTVANALGAIFGWTIQIDSGGMANDFEAAGTAAEDMADGTGDAAKNAKKLSKYIAAWHEVNNMTTDDSNKKGSGSGGGAGDLGDLSGYQANLVKTDSLLQKYESEIDTLRKLGKYIGDTLSDAMESINWDAVYEKARNFGTGLADFLNGLFVDSSVFASLGKTIAGSLNTALYALNSFGTTFDWIGFGKSIADGINNFFSNFDFGLLANTINVWVHGLFDLIVSTLANINWSDVFKGIEDFFQNLDISTIAIIIGALEISRIGKLVSGANIIQNIASTIGLKLSSSIGAVIASRLGMDIAAGSSTTLSSVFLKLGTEVGTTFVTGFKALLGSSAAESALAFVNPIILAITGIASVIGGAVTAGLNFFSMWKDGFSWLNEAVMVVGIAIAGIGAVILGAPALVAGAVAGIVAALGTAVVVIHDNWDSIVEFFTTTFDKLKTTVSEKLGQIVSAIQSMPDKIGSAIECIANWFNSLPEKIGYALGYASGTITKWAIEVNTYLFQKIPETISSVVNWFLDMPNKIKAGIDKFIPMVNEWGINSYNQFKNSISEIIAGVVNWFSAMPGKIYDAIIKVKDKLDVWKTNINSFFATNIPQIVKRVVDLFGDLPKQMVTVGENIIKGLWNGINNMVGWIGDKIKGFTSGIVNGFKEGFDEHSPSKIAFQIGDYWTIGLGNGMSDKFSDIYKQVENFTDNIAKTQISIPKLDLSVPDTDFTPKMNFDSGKLSTTMHDEIDVKMAEYSYQMRQLQQSIENQNQILEEMNAKGLVFDDNAMVKKYQTAATKFRRQTGRQLGIAY